MLAIWGRMTSVNVQKVMFAVGELGVAHERRDAGGPFGLVDTPDYRAMNPNGLVPVIDDDGLVLWESNVIVRYLAARYGAGSLWPLDSRDRALADQWADWQQTTFNPALGPAFANLVRTPPEKRDPAAIEASRLRTEAAMALLDVHLGRQPYLGGASLTFADCILAPSVHRWLNMPIDRADHRNVALWYAGIYARPSAPGAMPLPVA